MLFCKKCGAEVQESFRFCEKCFADLRTSDAVVNNCGLASQAAGKAIESGDFIPDAFIRNYDLSGCRIGDYRLSEKTGAFLGNDYYSAVDVNTGGQLNVRYFTISERDCSDRSRLISAQNTDGLTSLAAEICNNEYARFKSACKLCSLECADKKVNTYLTSDGRECHIFIAYGEYEPLALMLNRRQMSIRDIVKISLDICKYFSEFERNNITFNSIFESNIFVGASENAVLSAEYDRMLQNQFIDTAVSLGYSMYIPPDYRSKENSSVYSLAVMLYRLFNGGRLPYMNYFKKSPDYSDFLKAELGRRAFFELQMPVKAENMLGNLLSSIISNSEWREIKIADVQKTLENALNYLSPAELDRKIN